MTDDVTTWHHGLIARWWALFAHGGPEIDLYAQWFDRDRPVLDAACGAGRLLVPWALAGFDVDGVDVSDDMIAECRAAASAAGLHPDLHVQPLHLLALPRHYGTIVVCGSYGLGGSVDDDHATLDGLRAHLLPGGTLILDYEVGEFDRDRLRRFSAKPADPSPPSPDQRRRGGDGCDYALRHRMVAVDAEAKQVTREMQAWKWSGDDLLAHETHLLRVNIYAADDVTAALHSAGFEHVTVVGGYHGGPPATEDRIHVWIAR